MPPAPRKVIIDCDPGIDDAVALLMALFDPRLEVLAVTAVGGSWMVPADLIVERNWSGITQLARRAADLAEEST